MKTYKVNVYNMVDRFLDCYQVNAEDSVDARNVVDKRAGTQEGAGEKKKNERV